MSEPILIKSIKSIKYNKDDVLQEVAKPIEGTSYYYNTGLKQNTDKIYEYKLCEYMRNTDDGYIVKPTCSEYEINTDKLYELKTKLEGQSGGKRKTLGKRKTRRKKMTKKRQRKNNRK